jgi:hypothetical protein
MYVLWLSAVSKSREIAPEMFRVQLGTDDNKKYEPIM